MIAVGAQVLRGREMGTDPVIRAVGLAKRFDSHVALRRIDLEVSPGEVFGYIGPNGAGKTTTLRILLGLLQPSAGRAEILGHDCWLDSSAVHRHTGYLPADASLYPRMNGHQHITYFAALRKSESAKEAASALSQRLDLDLSRKTKELSRGNRQKLALVLAMMSRPRLLVLDEPTSGLDPLVQQDFHALLREHTQGGGSVLFSSHVLSEVERVADRVGIIRDGTLVAIESIHELHQKSLHDVSIQFAEAPNKGLFDRVVGLRDLAISGNTVTCSAPAPSLDALIKTVATEQVLDFNCSEADLEDMFLAYYGSENRDA